MFGLRHSSHPILDTGQVPLLGCVVVLNFCVILAQENHIAGVASQLLRGEENVKKGAKGSKRVTAAKPEKRLSWVTARVAGLSRLSAKNGHETFRQARIYNFRDKCVVFARNLKILNSTQ